MCSLGHTDFDLSTVGHNGLTVQGVSAAGVHPSAPWENITQWKAEAKNVQFFVDVKLFQLRVGKLMRFTLKDFSEALNGRHELL